MKQEAKINIGIGRAYRCATWKAYGANRVVHNGHATKERRNSQTFLFLYLLIWEEGRKVDYLDVYVKWKIPDTPPLLYKRSGWFRVDGVCCQKNI